MPFLIPPKWPKYPILEVLQDLQGLQVFLAHHWVDFRSFFVVNQSGKYGDFMKCTNSRVIQMTLLVFHCMQMLLRRRTFIPPDIPSSNQHNVTLKIWLIHSQDMAYTKEI